MEIHISQLERRSWIEIDLSRIKSNYLRFREHLPSDTDIMAVVKADAYGHGDVQVARMLSGLGVHLFAVSNIDEAVGLREAGIKGEILILGYSSPVFSRILSSYDLTQSIISEEYAEELASYGQKVKCQFAIDTGMNRIGLNADNPEECERIIREYSSVMDVNGIFTHLCVADTDTEECNRFTDTQIQKFETIAGRILDLNLPYVHCFNSAGGMYHYRPGKLGKIIRLGITLYGLNTDSSRPIPEGISSAMSWKTVVSMVKDVNPGETIGYGRTYKVTSRSRIATITTGYADGLNRLLSNRGSVIVNGKKAPIVGNICMDQAMIDVTGIEGVGMGTKVTIIGRNGDISYTADDMARDLGTIGYEIICNITKRVQRFYVNSNANL